MGTYVQFEVKPGCADQVNDLFAALTGNPKDRIVYSPKTIEFEIAFIHSAKGKSQAHLRPYLNNVGDWDKLFPAMRCGTGQIKVSGVDEDDAALIEKTKRNIQFILDNRMLFKKITGLDDAVRHEFSTFKGDLIEDHKVKSRPPSGDPTFADLPKGRSELYKKCVRYSRPDLWNAYLQFKEHPSKETWLTLRDKVIPWASGPLMGLWAMVEALATKNDGQSFGLRGRFRDDNIPPFLLVRRALAQ